MLMIDVLLKAAEYVEQQEHLQQYNDATSSSSSSSSSDISINNNTINSNISNLSTSGYSSGGSNSSTTTVTQTPSSRFLPIIENQKTKFTNISNITHQDVSSNKRVNYSQNNNKTSLSSSNLPTTSSNATAALNNVNTNQRLIKSEYTNGRNSMPFNSGRSSKYQQNMSILRLEEIKR
jgi:hypothetical protein